MKKKLTFITGHLTPSLEVGFGECVVCHILACACFSTHGEINPHKARKRHLNGRLRVFHWDGISVENATLLPQQAWVSIEKSVV